MKINKELEEQLRKEFQEYADSGLWQGEDKFTKNFAIGNVEDWWINKINDIIFGEKPKKLDYSNNVCKCLHARKLHGKSFSINYTEGKCSACNCRNFLMK